MKNSEKYLMIFLFGGLGYGFLESVFRGFTHWSMVITGGSALLIIYMIYSAFSDTPIIIKALAGCGVITTLEFTVGLIVNKLFSFGVWDYTNTPANIMGIISLRFSICWFVIALVMILFFSMLNKIFRIKVMKS